MVELAEDGLMGPTDEPPEAPPPKPRGRPKKERPSGLPKKTPRKKGEEPEKLAFELMARPLRPPGK
jgi:hypothetical protein